MGSLIYGTQPVEFKFEDRVLAHLQVVISAKLRRGESFFLSWFEEPAVGSGRNAIWVNASIPLVFCFSGSRVPTLNKAWLEEMAIAAGSNQGLILLEEPPADGAIRSEETAKRRTAS
ncbi:MAG: ATP-dependent DNA ligase [Salinibacterium sp.]|nr:MAG: ATP-dependent DNA ligase [Salinibacterium sp.]